MTFTDPDATDFVRDQWQRPLVIPVGGGKPVPYTRASAAAKTVEDTYNLEMYAWRNVAFGMSRDASLTARTLAVGGDPSTWDQAAKRAVDRIVLDAATVAQAHRAADIGTALHRLTERVDRHEPGIYAGPYEADINAYLEALTAAGLVPTHVECRMVCDTLEMAGTADRIVRDLEDRHRILDLKTGASVQYGGLGWAAQLAAYAHGLLYDVATGARLDTPVLDRTVGYICHLPAGEGVCRLYEIDLVAGHRAAVLANEIRQIRRDSRRWISPLAVPVMETAAATLPAVLPDRREELRTRYRALTPEQQDAFKAQNVDGQDLDAVDAALSALEAGVVAGAPATATAPTPAEVDATLGHDHDEGGEHLDGWETLEALYQALPAALQGWFHATSTEAQQAAVPFNAHRNRTARRFHLYRGLLLILSNFTDTDELADVVRGLAHYVLGDAVLFPSVTVGHAVGAMDADEAFRFANSCDLYTAGRMAADVTGPHLRLVPV